MSGIKRRTCPSLPARGRHDQPRAITNHARPAANAVAAIRPIRFEPPPRHLRPWCWLDRWAYARLRPRSVTWPCTVHRPETTSISNESSARRIKKRPVPRYSPRDRSSFPRSGSDRTRLAPNGAGRHTRRDSSASVRTVPRRPGATALLVVLAVDHRRRQLRDLLIGLVVGDRGVLLTLLSSRSRRLSPRSAARAGG